MGYFVSLPGFTAVLKTWSYNVEFKSCKLACTQTFGRDGLLCQQCMCVYITIVCRQICTQKSAKTDKSEQNHFPSFGNVLICKNILKIK